MKKEAFLKKIIQQKKIRIDEKKNLLSLEQLKEKLNQAPAVRDFKKAISKSSEVSLIAEIKKASPSKGLIRSDFDVLEIIKAYETSGVQAVSVLTEEDFFQGSMENIRLVRENSQLAILRKDFILDSYQVFESRVFGADCILLIVSLLKKDLLVELIDLANSLGMNCLVEVHNEIELKRVLSLKKDFILGINNRDLQTFEVDIKTSEKMLPFIPKGNTIVVESGIRNYQDVLFLKFLRVNAVLIGETFMRSDNIVSKVKEVMNW
ncbi:MAG: indole-3-glycerol phosphate synthase TrpC [Candidatus Gygaella obscura]|nr:indole-3-glycerol phosphate synthase TrpC [Candidatus Gygaella obscura]